MRGQVSIAFRRTGPAWSDAFHVSPQFLGELNGIPRSHRSFAVDPEIGLQAFHRLPVALQKTADVAGVHVLIVASPGPKPRRELNARITDFEEDNERCGKIQGLLLADYMVKRGAGGTTHTVGDYRSFM